MLTQYDEFPVHQSPHPFSVIPITDLNWSDGWYYAVYDRQGSYVLYLWMRVYANTDMVDGCVGLLYDGGRHYSIRLSRQWRPQCDTRIGPLSFTVTKPFKEIRMTLEENDFDFTCDLTWIGIAPAFQEHHHKATHWGKVTNDQTRYTQNGTAKGGFTFRGQRIQIDPKNWWGVRDHSWGIYGLWSPFGRNAAHQFMPPREPQEKERALRMWVPACFEDHSAFYHWHESREAEITALNDVFGTPFEGRIDFAWGEKRPPVKLSGVVRHDLDFLPGTRVLNGGRILLNDTSGKQLEHRFKVIAAPLAPQIGSWKDGRPNGVYRGPLAMEEDEIDLRNQPVGEFQMSGHTVKSYHGTEYISEIIELSDEGEKKGWAHIEFVLAGRYARFGFENDEDGW